jgi:indole-3-glycerol phosphate synthase
MSTVDLSRVSGILGELCRQRAGDARDAARRLPLERLQETGPGRAGRFAAALTGQGIAVIAEVKRATPADGLLRDLDAAATARAYAEAGAAAISVLTEPRRFRGELADLVAVRGAVEIPVLRKDFVVDPYQVWEARAAGADAVLLIAAALGEALEEFLQVTADAGLDALVEVHDPAELARAGGLGARLIGINNRDLRTLEVDMNVAPRLAGLARESGYSGVLIAESGYLMPADLAPLDGLVDAVLVGRALVRASDPAAAVRALVTR